MADKRREEFSMVAALRSSVSHSSDTAQSKCSRRGPVCEPSFAICLPAPALVLSAK